VAIAMLVACSSKTAPDPTPQPAPRPRPDAGVPGITTIHDYDPASGMHLDEGGDRRPSAPAGQARQPHPIDVTLRSSPSGAQVAVDGVPIGYTPTYWPGQADGREHEFTFVLPGHATARYRFVPITSGVIHARLEPIAEEPDAGVSEGAPEGAAVPREGAGLVNSPPAPVAPSKDAYTPAPPPTVIAPPGAAEVPTDRGPPP
jgi:hypothetical protein